MGGSGEGKSAGPRPRGPAPPESGERPRKRRNDAKRSSACERGYTSDWEGALSHGGRRDEGPRHVHAPADKALIMREARDCLTRPSRDLAMVCALAGVDMGAVIDRMRKSI